MGRLSASSLEDAFARAPVLSALSPQDRAELARSSRVVELKSREVLWREGAKADSLGLVLLGRVAVERVRRKAVIVDVVGAGDFVGEVAFTLGAKYQFDVRCLRKARVVLISATSLRRMLETRPRAAVSLAMTMAEEVLKLTRRVESLSAGSVTQRLARVLVGLADRFGEPFPGGVLMPVRLRREDLASLGATTLESASRQISAWKNAGLVVPQPAGMLLRDVSKLRAIGESAG
ncbi:MAG: Crp/Fnr family transcriptional regulator [Archangium sp.]